jgi:hypothetical protein
LFVGKHDTLGDPTDAASVFKTLKSGVFYKEYENCDHFSFMSGKDTSFNADIVEQIRAVGEVEESVPEDYPFVEEVTLNLY